jgi:hypothetical protein
LLTEWRGDQRFSKFHPSASQQRARPIDKISAQDETLRGGGVAFAISVNHGDGLLSAKRGIHVRDSGMSRQSLDVAKRWLLLEFKPRRAGIVTHLSQAVG